MKKVNWLTLEDFLEKATKVHNNFYDYSFVNFEYGRKVNIICPLHGDFKQSSWHHIHLAHKCYKCATKELKKHKFPHTDISYLPKMLNIKYIPLTQRSNCISRRG